MDYDPMVQRYISVDNDEIVAAMPVLENNVGIVAAWCGGREVEEIDPFDPDIRFPAVNVPTANGVERARHKDYVVKGVTGVFKIYHEDVFQHKFRPAPRKFRHPS